MTAVDYGLLVAAVVCWGLAICLLACRVRLLNKQVNHLSTRLGQVQKFATATDALARRRAVGRAGR